MVFKDATIRQMCQEVNENGQRQLTRMAQARPARTGMRNGTPPSATAFNTSSTGRWTKAEHNRFLDALEKHPSGPWQLITDLVGTRTVRQVMTHAQKYRQRIERRKAAQEASAYSPLPCSTSSESVTSPSESDDSIDAVADVEMEQTGGVLAGEASQLLLMNAIPTPQTHEAGGNFSERAHPSPLPTGQLQPEYADRHVDIASAPDSTPNGEGFVFDSSIFDLPTEILVQSLNFQQTDTTTEIQDGGNAPPPDQLLPEQLHSPLHVTGGSDINTFPPNVSPDHLVSGEIGQPFGGSSFETAMSVTTGEVSGEHQNMVWESAGPADEPPLDRNWLPGASSSYRAMDAPIADWAVDSEWLADFLADFRS